jgi:hypothetical protein
MINNKNPMTQSFLLKQGNQTYQINPELAHNAAKALKGDMKISRDEYNELIETAIKKDGFLTEGSRQFIGLLDQPDFAKKLIRSAFDPVQSNVVFNSTKGEARLKVDGTVQSVRNAGAKSLEHNLKVGKQVEKEVASEVMSSNQFGDLQQGAISLLNIPLVAAARKHTDFSSPDKELDSPPPAIKAGSDYQKIHHIARVASFHNRGNCFEKASVAAIQLADRGVKPVEIFGKVGAQDTGGVADHAFVVIGRDPNSDINKPSTWGPTAVVVDPWRQQTYPASKLSVPKGYTLNRTDIVAQE